MTHLPFPCNPLRCNPRSGPHRPGLHWNGMILALAVGLVLMTHQGVGAMDQITPEALLPYLQSPQGVVVLDVRSETEYAAGHIPGAMNIPYREIPNRLDDLENFKNHEIVVYCEVGIRAGIAEKVLEQSGFQNILLLRGDIRAWRQQGLPLETGARHSVP